MKLALRRCECGVVFKKRSNSSYRCAECQAAADRRMRAKSEAAIRKARSPLKMTRCIACGAEFMKRAANHIRCADCKYAKRLVIKRAWSRRTYDREHKRLAAARLRQAHPERFRARDRSWRKANPSKAAAKALRHYRKDIKKSREYSWLKSVARKFGGELPEPEVLDMLRECRRLRRELWPHLAAKKAQVTA